jgi:hypothetical protein
MNGGLIFASPAAVIPPKESITEHQIEYRDLWTGVDGVTWDLSGWKSGVYLAPGLVGVGHAPNERYTQDSPAVAGSLFGGARALARPVQLPIEITTVTSPNTSWRDLCRRWWKGWSRTTPGTWTRIDSNGNAKHLRLRHNPAGDFALDIDPGLQPWVPWMVDAVADSPYWRGDPIERTFSSPKQYLFFGGGDPDDPAAAEEAPPLYISDGSNLASAQIPNPGDIPVVWRAVITGPFSAWSITINGGTVAGPAVADGATLAISTDLTYPAAILNGTTEVTRTLSKWDPRPVPPSDVDDDGELIGVPVEVDTTGSGSIVCSIEPLYELGL